MELALLPISSSLMLTAAGISRSVVRKKTPHNYTICYSLPAFSPNQIVSMSEEEWLARQAQYWCRFESPVWQGIFLLESTSSADSLVASVQPLCAITSINVCASTSVRVLKIPNTASYTTVWTHKNTCTLIGMLQGTMKCFFFFKCAHLHLPRNDCNTPYIPHWRKSPSTQLEQFSEGDRFSAYSIAHVQVNIMHKIFLIIIYDQKFLQNTSTRTGLTI